MIASASFGFRRLRMGGKHQLCAIGCCQCRAASQAIACDMYFVGRQGVDQIGHALARVSR